MSPLKWMNALDGIMEITPVNTTFDEIYDFFAAAPSAEAIIAFKPSAAADQRLHDLLDQNAQGNLTAEEHDELMAFLHINHFVKMIKLKTRLKSSSI